MWWFTGIYGFLEDSQKWRTWDLLDRLDVGNNLPWLCLGDFNEILKHGEKAGGNFRTDDRMDDFRNCLDRCNLVDLGFNGHKFTWSNKQAGSCNIQERLDRGLANVEWTNRFPGVRVNHLTQIVSDHCLVQVEWSVERKRRGAGGVKLYRFEVMWVQERKCEEIIKEVWRDNFRCSTADLMANVKWWATLCRWSDKEFGNIPKEVVKLNNELSRL